MQRHFRVGWMVTLAVIFALLGGSAGPAAGLGVARSAAPVFNVALFRVLYTDSTSTRSTLAQLGQAATEMANFFHLFSYGKQDLNVQVRQVSLGHPTAYYWSACQANAYDYLPCPRFNSDVYNAAAAGGFDFTNIQGIVFVSACGISQDLVIDAPMTVSGKKYDLAYDYDCAAVGGAPPPGASGVFWNLWLHNVSHMLELSQGKDFNAPFHGHSSGYVDGYSLLDTGFPGHASAFDLLDTSLAGFHTSFPGWLPAAAVGQTNAPAVVGLANAPSAATIKQTFLLAPIEQDPSTIGSAVQAIKIPLETERYFLVEGRKRINDDTQIYDEGVRIMEVEDSRVPPVKLIHPCDTLTPGGCIQDALTDPRQANCNRMATNASQQPAYCPPYPLWQNGETYTDAVDNVTIGIAGLSGNNSIILVTRGPHLPHPDVYLRPWRDVNGVTYDSPDIYIDSSCNGYEDEVGPQGLKYGRQPNGDVNGFGDDACANHPNRIHAVVHNQGDAPADHVVVDFYVPDPLGVGTHGSDAHWSLAGAADETQFPALASLAPGASADVYIPYTPNIDLVTAANYNNNFNFGVKVKIPPFSSELAGYNQDGEEEEDEVRDDEAVKNPQTGNYADAQGQITITPPSDSPLDYPYGVRPYMLTVNKDLPPNWQFSVINGLTFTNTQPGPTTWIKYHISIPSTVPEGSQMTLGDLWAMSTSQMSDPNTPSPGIDDTLYYHWHVDPIGGAGYRLHTVVDSQMTANIVSNNTGLILVHGNLPAGATGGVTVDFRGPGGRKFSQREKINFDGSFAFFFTPPVDAPGQWTADVFYQGDLTYSSDAVVLPAIDLPIIIPPKQDWLPILLK